MQKRCNGAKRNGIFSKCLHWICKYYAFQRKYYAFQRNATTPNSPIMAKSHPAGMHICYGIFAGISLRLCSISLRSFRITFTAYLPTHIKFLTEFRRKPSLGQLVYQFFKLCYTNAASKQLIPSLSSILAMLLKERFSVPESNLLTY